MSPYRFTKVGFLLSTLWEAPVNNSLYMLHIQLQSGSAKHRRARARRRRERKIYPGAAGETNSVPGTRHLSSVVRTCLHTAQEHGRCLLHRGRCSLSSQTAHSLYGHRQRRKIDLTPEVTMSDYLNEAGLFLNGICLQQKQTKTTDSRAFSERASNSVRAVFQCREYSY